MTLALLGWLLVLAGYVVAGQIPVPAVTATRGLGAQFGPRELPAAVPVAAD